MSENTIKINRIPAITWNRLDMNEVSISVPDVCQIPDSVSVSCPEDVSLKGKEAAYNADVSGAMGEIFDARLAQCVGETQLISVSKGVKASAPVVIRAEYKDGISAGSKYVIEAEEASDITVLTDFSNTTASAKGRACFQTLINAGKSSKVTLVQIVRFSDGFELVNDVGASLGEEAGLNIVHIFLGGDNIYQGCNIRLLGDNSFVKKDIGYFLNGEQNLDMNYIVLHEGRKTNCDIKASGVLEGSASKLFRGTIDFKNGCSGSKGAEIEEVILRDDTVCNKTLPVILCAEEDVEGSHGATIGRLDEDLIFYMQTRGMEEEEIYRLISKNRLLSFCNKIPDEDIRNKTMNFK